MKMKILVIDDEPILRDMMMEVLKDLGHEVETADGCFRAFELLRSDEFDLIITDNDMARINSGMAIIQFSQSLSYKPHIIWMSARVGCEPSLADMARILGACEILSKPFELKELHAMIHRIEKSRKSDPVPA